MPRSVLAGAARKEAHRCIAEDFRHVTNVVQAILIVDATAHWHSPPPRHLSQMLTVRPPTWSVGDGALVRDEGSQVQLLHSDDLSRNADQ
jgi:hypothetical protein